MLSVPRQPVGCLADTGNSTRNYTLWNSVRFFSSVGHHLHHERGDAPASPLPTATKSAVSGVWSSICEAAFGGIDTQKR